MNSAAPAVELARAFDLRRLDASFYADPYPVYDALRTHEPVKRMPDGSLFLTRYRDIQAVYRDAKAFSSDKTVEFGPKYGIDAALRASHDEPRLQRRPAPHARAQADRGRVDARAIASMEPGLIALVDGLLDRARRSAASSI